MRVGGSERRPLWRVCDARHGEGSSGVAQARGGRSAGRCDRSAIRSVVSVITDDLCVDDTGVGLNTGWLGPGRDLSVRDGRSVSAPQLSHQPSVTRTRCPATDGETAARTADSAAVFTSIPRTSCHCRHGWDRLVDAIYRRFCNVRHATDASHQPLRPSPLNVEQI